MAHDTALLDSLDQQLNRQHPAFGLVRDIQPWVVVSQTESCEKCATKIVAVTMPEWSTPRWCALGDVYQAGPDKWKCRMVLHTPERCAEKAKYFQPIDGALW